MPSADYVVRFPDPQDARAALEALVVDLEEGLGGSRVSVTGDGDTVRIHIDSDEVGHLRAATNSFLKRLHAAAGALRESHGPS